MLKKTLIGSAIILLIFAAIGYTLPAEYESKRSIDINAPIEAVFEQVNVLVNNEAWSPWLTADPNMKLTYNDIPAGKGASYDWVGEKTGAGSATITESIPFSKIDVDLDFGQEGVVKGFWTFEPVGSAVRATWGVRGDAGMNPLARYFGLLMDRMIGTHFEMGLSRLKTVCENKTAGAATK